MSNSKANSSLDSERCSRCRRQLLSNKPDYYWRDYLGEIPDDAIPGGKNINQQTTYIGQGYKHRWGMLVGQIYPGVPGIYLPLNGNAHRSDVGVKILCGSNPEAFVWQKAESNSLHVTTIGKHLVIGGFQDDHMINIGRAMYQGELIVGKVLGFEIEKANLYFVHKEKEVSVSSYEVLIYKN